MKFLDYLFESTPPSDPFEEIESIDDESEKRHLKRVIDAADALVNSKWKRSQNLANRIVRQYEQAAGRQIAFDAVTANTWRQQGIDYTYISGLYVRTDDPYSKQLKAEFEEQNKKIEKHKEKLVKIGKTAKAKLTRMNNKELHADLKAHANNTQSRQLAAHEIASKISNGNYSVSNPYFTFQTNRYAGSAAHYNWAGAAKMYAAVNEALKAAGYPPLKYVYASKSDDKGADQSRFGAYAVTGAGGHLLWACTRETGYKNYLFAGKKKLRVSSFVARMDSGQVAWLQNSIRKII